jgi:hypothetical protein
MVNVDTDLVRWCMCLATMILLVEKVLAACVHWSFPRRECVRF